MPLDPREGLHEFSDFKGLRNTIDPADFEAGDLVAALNVDIDDAAGLNRRRGYSMPVTIAIDRSLYAAGGVCLGVGGNALKRLLPDYSVQVLRSGLTPGALLSYAAVSDRVYYANGFETGVVEARGQHRSWGLPVPGRPTAAADSGNLPAGRYQVAVSYLRAGGQESGVGVAAVVEVPAAGGVRLTGVPVASDSSVIAKAVYMSTRDGEVLYRVGVIDAGDTGVLIQDEVKVAGITGAQHLQGPPAGQVICYANGYMLVAAGNVLYPSEPYAPELFDLRKGMPFLDRITMLAALADSADGIWLGTATQVIWLAGATPEEWRLSLKANYGVIPGSAAYADGELLADGSTTGKQTVYFATAQGLCVGRPGGLFANLTAERYNYPAMETGAGLVRRHRGTAQYIATLQGTAGTPNVFE